MSPEQAAQRLQVELREFAFKDWYRWRYLKSPRWKALRSRKLAANSHCEVCKTEPAEQVHHKRYRSIFDVELKDLQSICRKCHCAKHSLPPPKPEEPRESFYEYRARIERKDDEAAAANKRLRRSQKKHRERLSPEAQVRHATFLEKTTSFRPRITY